MDGLVLTAECAHFTSRCKLKIHRRRTGDEVLVIFQMDFELLQGNCVQCVPGTATSRLIVNSCIVQ